MAEDSSAAAKASEPALAVPAEPASGLVASRFDQAQSATDCKWCADSCGWYTSHSGGFARWIPCNYCNSDGTTKRDPFKAQVSA